MMRPLRPLTLTLCALCLSTSTPAQQPAAQAKASAKKPRAAEADPMEEVRRASAVSLVNALADDARTFREPLLRSRVQARAADALWETDRERARELFRRAWAEAETADAEADRRVAEERRRQERERGSFSIQLPPSLRTEVLRLAARRDRELGEEFLTRMEASRKEQADATESLPTDSPGGDNDRQTSGVSRRNDPSNAPPAVAKRLRLAVQLLEDGDVERAVLFADPALGAVNAPALEFLARLRQRNPKAADERYAALLARAGADPASDPNTASLLASYLFTPALFVTFSPGGGSSSNSWARNFPAPTDVAPQLVSAYFNTAAAILLRPLPPPDQDTTSTGRTGWYMVITRLLTLFDRYAPDKSAALRARQSALVQDAPENIRREHPSLTRGLVPEDPNRDRVGETLARLERAQTQEERDAVYVDAVFSAVQQKDPRVEEFLNKIDDADLRKRLRAYVDFEATQAAVRNKETAEALRLARGGSLTPIQKAWALTEVAKLLAKREPARALELLEESLTEAKERIDPASPERAGALVAVATQLIALDRPRAWEVMLDAVKASNAARAYTGEDGRLSVRLETKNMTISSTNSAEGFDLGGIFSTLAREDLNRAVALARNFEGESPRAVATLAIARAVLERGEKK